MPLKDLVARAAYKRRWALENKEKVTDCKRAWRLRNLDQVRAQDREKMRRYYLRHPDRVRARSAAWRAANPGKVREINRKQKAKLGPEYGRAAANKWRLAHPELIRERQKAYHMRTREQVREKNLKHFYGITLAQFDEMIRSQDGRCAVCRDALDATPFSKRRTHVDHCHATGRVRGILCRSCNLAAGLVRDDPEVAEGLANYLRRTRDQEDLNEEAK